MMGTSLRTLIGDRLLFIEPKGAILQLSLKKAQFGFLVIVKIRLLHIMKSGISFHKFLKLFPALIYSAVIA
jgi:hypothetical protein